MVAWRRLHKKITRGKHLNIRTCRQFCRSTACAKSQSREELMQQDDVNFCFTNPKIMGGNLGTNGNVITPNWNYIRKKEKVITQIDIPNSNNLSEKEKEITPNHLGKFRGNSIWAISFFQRNMQFWWISFPLCEKIKSHNPKMFHMHDIIGYICLRVFVKLWVKHIVWQTLCMHLVQFYLHIKN